MRWESKRRLEIWSTTSELFEDWRHKPELRLGQLIVNALLDSGHREEDLFYISDAELLRCIRQFVAPKEVIYSADNDTT